MGLTSWLSQRLGRRSEAKTLDLSALSWESIYGAPSSKAGVSVSLDTALRVSTVLACVRVLAEDVAKVPLKLYREDEDGGKTPAKDHSLYRVLARRPNSWQTSIEFREQMMIHAVLDKGAFAYISRSVTGDVLELIPLLPSSVQPRQDTGSRTVTYSVSLPDGTYKVLPASQVLTIHGPSWNGYQGLQVVMQAREAIGLAIATEEQQARIHANGGRPGGLLSSDSPLTQDQVDKLAKRWQDAHGEVKRWGGTAILPGGLKYQSLSQTAVESQTLEARRLQIEEICRMFRVFPIAIGYSDKTSTFASAEAFLAAHVVHSLTPWVERWEQAISRDLLTDAEVEEGYFAKHTLAGLLRGDTAARTTYYKAGINDGWLTRNEARALEDFNPIDGLDVPLMPLNMTDGTAEPDDGTPDDAAEPDDASPMAPPDPMMGMLAALSDGLERLGEAIANRGPEAKPRKALAVKRDKAGQIIGYVEE